MADTTSPYRDVLPLPASSSGRLAAPPGPTARRLGDLELLGELARGGMGVVYRALDRRLGREVAVKVALGGAADPEELERFAVEARAAARLKHPNIVGIHRVGEEGGAPYLVMDLVPGESLQRRLGRDGPLPPREAARLCALLARALAFAHGRGVLHRDLKPHNVLVTPDGQPVLTDFGLAKEV
ncbi:MAG: serine/threonine protein kinase, partial [Planctomycetes bacterium]|nr:serine/threonine protein kinase [Planctomycetota bacterium]